MVFPIFGIDIGSLLRSKDTPCTRLNVWSNNRWDKSAFDSFSCRSVSLCLLHITDIFLWPCSRFPLLNSANSIYQKHVLFARDVRGPQARGTNKKPTRVSHPGGFLLIAFFSTLVTVFRRPVAVRRLGRPGWRYPPIRRSFLPRFFSECAS